MARVSRRAVLKYGAIGMSVTALASGGGVGWAFLDATTDTADRLDFDNALAIPPLADSEVDDDGRRTFALEADIGELQIHPGEATTTWGLNGDYLGPTLRATRGETVAISVTNNIGETTSLHWHGMHLPAAMDGGPHQEIDPGDTWTPTWTIDQPAATLWYHPHPHGATAQHVYRGAAGLFLVDDPEADALGLPSEYGVDDIPVIVQDKNFDRANQFNESPTLMGDVGIVGDTILVNGTHAPYLEVGHELVRLRLLNASNARVFAFGFVDEREFQLIATDGGLLPAPHTMTRIQLSPGERAEILVSFTPDEEVVLRGFPPDLGRVGAWSSRFDGGDDTFDILQVRTASELHSAPAIPEELAPAPDLDLDGVENPTRVFQLAGRSINNEHMDMRRINFATTVDSVEIWEVFNGHATHHNFHVHDVQFQVISVDGVEPPPELRGWKDTIFLPPYERFRIAMHFKNYTDPDVPYMYHCHILYHEDQGMMGQFVVVEPGQEPGLPETDHAAH
ncbi:multicopper oxidase domain-containing protein [Spiractinospora alimapuensis]|uniref:multicopper oxidase family protein n=1 Tax=Spiractinospora alimapuensis TaxID=2820884 RepID=UPI001F43A385|nr:multicopper oxidase domain-containing protein [Spiractinospora alimapuensis]QVQ52624.1 multicopper oxidase domain-containing protein [Spiractinospora alimapuensis]